MPSPSRTVRRTARLDHLPRAAAAAVSVLALCGTGFATTLPADAETTQAVAPVITASTPAPQSVSAGQPASFDAGCSSVLAAGASHLNHRGRTAMPVLPDGPGQIG